MILPPNNISGSTFTWMLPTEMAGSLIVPLARPDMITTTRPSEEKKVAFDLSYQDSLTKMETWLLRPADRPGWTDWRVIINDDLCIGTVLKQFRFPRTKKKRIIKKWGKKRENCREVIVDRVLCMPKTGDYFFQRKNVERVSKGN